MGCVCSSLRRQQEEPPDGAAASRGVQAAQEPGQEAEEVGPLADRPDVRISSTLRLDGRVSSVGPAGGFKRTSDLRVGVIEGKERAVTLLNDYIVLGSLGKGAYGSVKLCYSMLDDGLYALKVLQRTQLKRQMLGPRPGGSGGQQGPLDMLRREVDVMRSMNHPNLIKIFEVIEAANKVVLVQEYAEAGPLAQPDQVMSEVLARFYFRQIVAGLLALHSQNVVHGDMKPDNVLLSGSGLVKIADFGQAHFFDEGVDVFDKTLGTPAFMAPEMRSGGSYHGMPADMWALGVTLYSFVFGDVPFKGRSLEDLYGAIQREEVRYPAHIPISDSLRSVLDGLLSKDPAKRPTALQLTHHPWVAEEEAMGAMPLELDRLDDAPSLENWIHEMALQEREELPPLVQEVAVAVFGRDLVEGAQSFNVEAIMEAINESTSVDSTALQSAADALLLESPFESALPPVLAANGSNGDAGVSHGGGGGGEGGEPSAAGAPAASAPPQEQQLQASAAGKEAHVQWAVAPAAAAAAAGNAEHIAAPPQPFQQQQQGPGPAEQRPEAARAASGPGSPRLRPAPSGLKSTEQVAAALNQLLSDIGDGLAAVGKSAGKVGKSAGKLLSPPALGEGAGAEEDRVEHGTFWTQQAQAAQQHAASQGQPQSPLQRRRHDPVAAEGPVAPSAPACPPPPPKAIAIPQAPAHTPFPSTAVHTFTPPRHGLHAHSLGPAQSSLPLSPFESLAVGSLEPPSAIGRALIRAGTSQQPAGSGLEAALGGGGGALAGPLGSTADVWTEMRRKTEVNQVPGVRFVHFQAGQAIDVDMKSVGNVCLLIEKGIVDVQYVAQLKLTSRLKRQGSGSASSSASSRSSGDGGSSSGSDSEDEGRLQRRDTLARGPDALAISRKKRKGQGQLEPSESLKATVDQILERAERLLGSATKPGEANLLATVRGPSDFVGVGPMLEPARHRKLSEKWARHMTCRTEVTGALLSRAAVELLLQHYPLAQVYLRITLSKGRAEMLQLEALENIASCMRTEHRERTTSGKERGGRVKLDIFRAISFARRLAQNVESLAEQALKP